MRRNGIKRRIYDRIVVSGESLYTLFDTGAWNSYITRAAAYRCKLKLRGLNKALRVGLGGEKRLLREHVSLEGSLRRHSFHLEPYVVDELGHGDEDRKIDLLFGLLAMEQWGVQPDVRNKRIDLTYFTKDFIEY